MPILQKRKLRIREDSSLLEVIQLEGGRARSQTQLCLNSNVMLYTMMVGERSEGRWECELIWVRSPTRGWHLTLPHHYLRWPSGHDG